MFKFFPGSIRSSLNQRNLVLRWNSIMLTLVLALIISTVNPAPAVQAAPSWSTELHFSMLASKNGGSKPVCVGELVTIEVLVLRLKVVNGVSEAPEAITGISVNGVVVNTDIGQISPPENTTHWASVIYPGAADFVFTAEKPGETIVAFSGMIVLVWHLLCSCFSSELAALDFSAIDATSHLNSARHCCDGISTRHGD